MKPHPFDRLSFIAGTMYVLFAVAVLARADLLQARWGWIWPVALLLFGVALLPRRPEVVDSPEGPRTVVHADEVAEEAASEDR